MSNPERVIFTLSIGYQGQHKETFHCKDDLGIDPETHSQEQFVEAMDAEYKDWVGNYLDGTWVDAGGIDA